MTPVFRPAIASIVLALTVGASAALAETNAPTGDLSTDVNFISAKQAIAAKDCEEYKDLAKELAEYKKKC